MKWLLGSHCAAFGVLILWSSYSHADWKGVFLILGFSFAVTGFLRFLYDGYAFISPKLRDSGFQVPQVKPVRNTGLQEYARTIAYINSLPLDADEKEAIREEAKAKFLESLGREFL
ncbi:MAG: hypothetical protein KC653_00645 [Candidatus Andersenbacteria bacterium]|nr:hypothetical protein [Candidatus Andersenbacteria bacterium]